MAFLGTRTKAEIQQRAVANAWLIGPAWDASELLTDPQLQARELLAASGAEPWRPLPLERLPEVSD